MKRRTYIRLEFKAQDLWIGAYWHTSGSITDIWICLLPTLPIHITIAKLTANS
jgi:hypothetical protein